MGVLEINRLAKICKGADLKDWKGELKEPPMKTQNKGTFYEHLQEHMKNSKHGIYGWFDLMEDAKDIELEITPDLMSLTRQPGGFSTGGNAKYKGIDRRVCISMIPGLFLVSTLNDNEGMKILEEGFGKLFRQKPNAVYKDLIHTNGEMITAEWYIGMEKKQMEEMMDDAKNSVDYELIKINRQEE